jgi:hypothetical protein
MEKKLSKLMIMNKKSLQGVEFFAFIPPRKSAITFGDDSALLKLEIPPECRELAKALVDMQGKHLRVLIEVAQ